MEDKRAAPRIFIVEDEAVVACALEGQLTAFGYEVSGVAGEAERALEAMAAAPPDVLLTDIRLKGDLDGIGLAERSRERFGVAVVFLTGYSDPETVSRAAKAQPYSFLVKPYSEREVRAAIEIALYRRSAEAELARYRLHLEELVGERTAELRESNRLLEEALAQVKRLSGLIPICMYCRRVRDDRQEWQKIEEYICAHSEADFSHGLCPECYKVKIAEHRASLARETEDGQAHPAA
jgi:DNA-binding NtrC family response regulator